MGLEYCYANQKYLDFSFSFVGVANNPIPFSFDKEGAYTNLYSSYFSITNNNQKDRLTYGYGVNYSINTRVEGFRSFENSSLNMRTSITNQAIGLTLNSYYRIGNSFNIGFIYRPTFFRPDDFLGNQYEHLISIEFAWKIRLNKKLR